MYSFMYLCFSNPTPICNFAPHLCGKLLSAGDHGLDVSYTISDTFGVPSMLIEVMYLKNFAFDKNENRYFAEKES